MPNKVGWDKEIKILMDMWIVNENLTYSNRNSRISNKEKVGKIIVQEKIMADNLLMLNNSSFQTEEVQNWIRSILCICQWRIKITWSSQLM